MFAKYDDKGFLSPIEVFSPVREDYLPRESVAEIN